MRKTRLTLFAAALLLTLPAYARDPGATHRDGAAVDGSGDDTCRDRTRTRRRTRQMRQPPARFYVHVKDPRSAKLRLKPKASSAASLPVTLVVRDLNGKVVLKKTRAPLGAKGQWFDLPGENPKGKTGFCAVNCYEILVYELKDPPVDTTTPTKKENASSRVAACPGPGAYFFDPGLLDGSGRPGTNPPPDPESCK